LTLLTAGPDQLIQIQRGTLRRRGASKWLLKTSVVNACVLSPPQRISESFTRSCFHLRHLHKCASLSRSCLILLDLYLYPQLIVHSCVCQRNLPIHLITSTPAQGCDVTASKGSIGHSVRVHIRFYRVKAEHTLRLPAVGVLSSVVVACFLSLPAGAFHASVTTSNGSINSQQPPPASLQHQT
jgi:hypothetical protein